jgi:nucleoside-diphosphate-sugar epimerase
MKTALVLGAGGFIGNHMVKRLKEEGYWVRGVDLKYPEYGRTEADHFVLRDLRHADDVYDLIGWAGVNRDPHQIFALQFDKPFDEIYQFAADMGGAGYIFTGNNDADIMHNSATINLNVLDAVREKNKRFQQNTTKIFYSSSACMYPEHNQLDPNNPNCAEDSAYPANPDSEYGWEKLFSERLYLAYYRNHDIPVRIARFHNIYGPFGTWDGGREKAPAAICRKVIQSRGEIEVWGDGEQTRSFLYIDDCIDAVRELMKSDFMGPVNIGSEEMVTINELVDMAAEIGRKNVEIKHIAGPTGVRGRNSDNRLIWEKLHWKPQYNLRSGLELTYDWIEEQIQKKVNKQMKDAITL